MKTLPLWGLSLLATFCTPLYAADTQQQALDALSDLNGEALHCSYHAQAKRIKLALIDTLPKTRRLGQQFEDRTNQAFLKLIEAEKDCPSEITLGIQIDDAIKALQTAYQTTPK